MEIQNCWIKRFIEEDLPNSTIEAGPSKYPKDKICWENMDRNLSLYFSCIGNKNTPEPMCLVEIIPIQLWFKARWKYICCQCMEIWQVRMSGTLKGFWNSRNKSHHSLKNNWQFQTRCRLCCTKKQNWMLNKQNFI